MPLELQAKLLRVLQEQSFGGRLTQTVDVRVLATTNRNLELEVEAGRFRGDSSDSTRCHSRRRRCANGRGPAGPEHFLGAVAVREGRDALGFSEEAMDVLQGHAWPGNVRGSTSASALRQVDQRIESSLIAPRWSAPTAWPPALWGGDVRGALALDTLRERGRVEVALMGADVTRMRRFMACDGRLTLADIEREAIPATLEAVSTLAEERLGPRDRGPTWHEAQEVEGRAAVPGRRDRRGRHRQSRCPARYDARCPGRPGRQMLGTPQPWRTTGV